MDRQMLSIEISEDFSSALARELVESISEDQRVKLAVRLSDFEQRDILRNVCLVTAEDAGRMCHWTAKGFRRVATRENCPCIKLGRKQPALYRLADVEDLLRRIRQWPDGKPLPETET